MAALSEPQGLALWGIAHGSNARGIRTNTVRSLVAAGLIYGVDSHFGAWTYYLTDEGTKALEAWK